MVNIEPPKEVVSPQEKIKEQVFAVARRVVVTLSRLRRFLSLRGRPIDEDFYGEEFEGEAKRSEADKKIARKNLLLLVSGLSSRDRPTRRMSVMFFLSLCIVVFSLTMLTTRTLHKIKIIRAKRAAILKKQALEASEKEADIERRISSVLSLGTFMVELKPMFNQSPGTKSANLAELEIVIICDRRSTRDYLSKFIVMVRNHLLNSLSAMDREELLAQDGKRKLRERIKRDLNDWLPQGNIRDLYIPKLVVD